MTAVVDPGPLDWRVSIVDKSGRPSPEFQRRWNQNRDNTSLIGTVTFASGAPTGTPAEGAQYINVSAEPFGLYYGHDGEWIEIGVQNFTELADVPQSYTGSALMLVSVNSAGTGLVFTSQLQPANPTATAGPTVINGIATTYMRSDAAPAVQTATTGQLGLVEPDGTTVTIAAGKISVPKATTSALGLVKPDGSTITISAGGVISSSGGGGGGGGGVLPTIRGSSVFTDNNNTFNIPLPSGTVAGDLAVLFAGHGYSVNSPNSTWFQFDNQQGGNANGGIFAKVLTSSDISTGYVNITSNGGYYGCFAMVTFVGSTSACIGFAGVRSGGANSPLGVTASGFVIGAMSIGWGYNRGTSIGTFSAGTLLQSASTGDGCCALYNQVTAAPFIASGSFSSTSSNNGYYLGLGFVNGP